MVLSRSLKGESWTPEDGVTDYASSHRCFGSYEEFDVGSYMETNGSTLVVALTMVVVIGLQLFGTRKDVSSAADPMVPLTTIGFLGLLAALIVSNQQNATAVFGLLGGLAGFFIGRKERSE